MPKTNLERLAEDIFKHLSSIDPQMNQKGKIALLFAPETVKTLVQEMLKTNN